MTVVKNVSQEIQLQLLLKQFKQCKMQEMFRDTNNFEKLIGQATYTF